LCLTFLDRITGTFEAGNKHRESEISQWFTDFVAAHQVAAPSHNNNTNNNTNNVHNSGHNGNNNGAASPTAGSPDAGAASASPAAAAASLQETPEAVTGLLLVVNGSAITCVLEAPADVLRALILSLANLTASVPAAATPAGAAAAGVSAAALSAAAASAAFLANCKVCAFSEEVPREFPVFAVRAVKATSEDFAAAASVNMTKIAFDTYRHLLELGRESAAQPADKQAEYLERSQARQLLNHVPAADKLAAFGACADMPSPAEWVAIFETPIEVEMDSDLTWPAEPWLKY